MTENAKVLVYRYLFWDEETRSRKTSSVYATAELIRNGLGTPVHTSALEVDRSDLRDGGIDAPRVNAPVSAEPTKGDASPSKDEARPSPTRPLSP